MFVLHTYAMVRANKIDTNTRLHCALIAEIILLDGLYMLRKTPLRRVSKKQAGLNRKYTILRREYLEIHPECEFPSSCPYRSTQIHHKMGRGKYTLEVSTWAALCLRHHDWCERNKNAARAIGMILYK